MTILSNNADLIRAMEQLNRTLRSAMKQTKLTLDQELEQRVADKLQRAHAATHAHMNNYDGRVNHFLAETRAYAQEVEAARICIVHFSPEARAFVARRLKELKDKIKLFEEEECTK